VTRGGQLLIRKAFTLIEILVVVAIIAVLVGLLLPALQSAREQARRTRCSVQLKQIAVGLTQYELDNNGRFPPKPSIFDDVNVPWGDVRPLLQVYLPDAYIFYCPASGRQSDAMQIARFYDYTLKGEFQIDYPIFANPTDRPGNGWDWRMVWQGDVIRSMGEVSSPVRQVLTADCVLGTWSEAMGPSVGNHLNSGQRTRKYDHEAREGIPGTVAGGNIGHFDTHTEWRNVGDMSVGVVEQNPGYPYWWYW